MNLGLLSNLIKENSINNNKNLENSLEKLSSSLKINKASDDASGLSIADKLRTQASGIKQSIANANSAVAMLNIADKGMSELSNILDLIKTKAIQMSTITTSDEGKKIIKSEILKLIDNYDNIVCQTNYNQTPLLNGYSSPLDFQIGDSLNDIISVDINSVDSRHMGEIDPYKLKNFITGFNTPEIDLNNMLSSDIPGLENFDWNSAQTDLNGNYVIEDFNGSLVGNQAMDLDNKTQKLLDINSNYINNIELTFNGFGASSELFTIYSSSGGIIGQIKGTDYSGNENVVVPLDTNFINSWDYSNLESTGIGNIILTGINDNVSIYATGAALDLTKLVITLKEDLSSVNTSESYNCNSSNLVRNDDSPTLLIQAQKLMAVVDEALNQLNMQRSNVGAGTNQVESSARNLITDYVNIKNAESIIRDVDYARESANFSKTNIILQAGSFVQIQAIKVDQDKVVSLLK